MTLAPWYGPVQFPSPAASEPVDTLTTLSAASNCIVTADLCAQVRINFIRQTYQEKTMTTADTYYHVGTFGPFPLQQADSVFTFGLRWDVLCCLDAGSPTVTMHLAIGDQSQLKDQAISSSGGFLSKSFTGSTTVSWKNAADAAKGLEDKDIGDLIKIRQNHGEQSVYPEAFAGLYVKASSGGFKFRFYGLYLAEYVKP